jgi:hypothetical protein
MLLWDPDVTAGSTGGIGIFYASAPGHDVQRLWRPYGADP